MIKRPSDDTYEVLLNTKKDSTILMIFWYIHKSFWALLTIGLLTALIFGQTKDDWFDFRNSRDFFSPAISPLTVLLIALVCKIVVDHAFTLTAYPLLKKRKLQVTNEPGNFYFRFFDSWRDLRGISTLRWTHAVRQQAMRQFESEFFRSDKLNNYIDIITLGSLVICIALLIVN